MIHSLNGGFAVRNPHTQNMPKICHNHSSWYQSLHKVARLTTIYLICLILSQDCAFNKLQSNSALRVSFHGNTRVQSHNKCNRWYFKFNGNECSGPLTIEAVIYNYWPSGNANLLYCENIPQGAVRFELWVGQAVWWPNLG